MFRQGRKRANLTYLYTLISGSRLGKQGTSNNCAALQTGMAGYSGNVILDNGFGLCECAKLNDMACSYKTAKSICEL